MTCPGYDPAKSRPMSEDAFARLTAEGTARQYHLCPSMPHLFCGCGSEAAACHPGRCCRNDDWGTCANCDKPALEVAEPPEPEDKFTDPLFNLEAK